MDWPAKTSKHSQRKAARAHLAAVSFPCKQRTQAVYSRLGKQKCSTQPPPAPVSVTSTASAPALGDWSLDRTLSGSLPSPCVFISRHFTARATTCDGRAWRRLPGTPRTDRIYKNLLDTKFTMHGTTVPSSQLCSNVSGSRDMLLLITKTSATNCGRWATSPFSSLLPMHCPSR